MSQKQTFLRTIESVFGVEENFCHEGRATAYCKDFDLNKKELAIQVGGTTIMEHSGDEESVYSNAHSLKGRTETFTFEGKQYTAKVKSSTVELKNEGSHDDDGDYEMSIHGEFVIEFI